MKVAVICIFAGKIERGAENLAYILWSRLPFETKVFSRYGSSWTIEIFCDDVKLWKTFADFIRKTGIYRGLYQIEKITPYFDMFSKDFFDILSFGSNLRKKLDIFQPDAIINITGSTVGFFLRRYRKERNIPFISVSGAGKNITEIKNAKTYPDAYIAQTPLMKEFIKRKSPKTVVELIPIGADLSLFSKGEKFTINELKNLNKIGDAEIENPLILSTSALEKQKRLDYLILAVSKLKKGTLVFTSDGTMREQWISLGKKLLNNRFLYLGVLDKKEIHKIYNTCDVFCLPSINEPFGNVFIEAMAANKPIVADNDEDRKWIVGEKGGILTGVRSVDKIAEALRKAYNTDWGDGPRKQAEKFSWDKIIRQYQDLIEKLVKEKQQCL